MRIQVIVVAGLFLSVLINEVKPQSHKAVWDSIKSHTSPTVEPAFQSNYGQAYKQPLADYGWEDGLQISTDGLNLYALYSPTDFLSWQMFFQKYFASLPICSLFGNMDYLRHYAKTYGMNLAYSPFGCDSFPNMDIVYAHRNSISDSFTTWQLSGVPRPGAFEGGPATLFSQSDSTHLDIFMMTGDGDIWMIKNTTQNPSDLVNAIRLPSPINPTAKEFTADNAFLERINNDTVIMIYEKYTSADARVFMYTFSADTGTTWTAPQAITTITNSLGHIEHPCLYKDEADQWWLYFSIDYTWIVRSKQTIKGNWNSWSAPEKIISKGNAISLGEPTITRNGDISFSLAYKNTVINDTTDVYDLDPWFLPRVYSLTVINGSGSKNYSAGAKVTISAATAPSGKIFDKWTGDIVGIANINSASTTITMPAANTSITATYKDIVNALPAGDNIITIYPNPASDFITILLNSEKESVIRISNLTGKVLIAVKSVATDKIMLSVQDLTQGIYIIEIADGEKNEVIKFVKN